MDDEPGIDCLLAGEFSIHGWPRITHGERGPAAAARDDAGACGRRINIEAARHFEWPHELAQTALVVCLGDDIQRVLALDDGLALDLHSVAPNVRSAEMIEKHRTQVGILSRAALGLVLMPHHEKCHMSSGGCELRTSDVR